MYHGVYGHVSPVKDQPTRFYSTAVIRAPKTQRSRRTSGGRLNRSFDREAQMRVWEKQHGRIGYSESPQKMYRQPPSYLSSTSQIYDARRNSWRIPKPQPTLRKSDIEKESRHRVKQLSQSMFRHFKYPDKVPTIPDKIHKVQLKRGRVNSAINDTEMRPSYRSHKENRVPSPSSVSSSEEELLYRAEEGESAVFSEPSSVEDSDPMPESEDEAELECGTPPYQAVEEKHYRGRRSSYRSVTKPEEHSSSFRSDHSKPGSRGQELEKVPHQKRVATEYELSPLHEEEFREKKSHKAQAPRSMPEPRSRPPPPPQMQFVPQPILYPMPQPFPMPIPYFHPQLFFPNQEIEKQKPEAKKANPPQRREMSTQYSSVTPTAQVTSMAEKHVTSQSTSAFIEALAEIDRKLLLKNAAENEVADVRKPVALEIGLEESKSLAERFQEKLPGVQAKLDSRNFEKPRSHVCRKSPFELLEIRRELLRPPSSTPRQSSLSQESSRSKRKESPCLKRVDPLQLEKSDRLAAGKSSVVAKKLAPVISSTTPDCSLSRIDEETRPTLELDRPGPTNEKHRGDHRPVKIQ